MRNQPEYSSGFTLIELMITIAIAGILLGIAIPSFRDTIASNRLTTNTNQLMAALSLARSEAVKRGVRVTVCKSANGNSCTAVGDWAQGWIIFTDENNNAAYNPPLPPLPGETLLKVQANSVNAISMSGNGSVANYISYVSTGQSQLTNLGFQAGTIKVCDDRIGNVGVNLILNNVGRISTLPKQACP